MPVETLADVASMFSTSDFAASATYTPQGGEAVSTTVMVDEGIEEFGGDLSAIQGDHTIALLVADVPSPERDARVVVTDPETAETTTFLVEKELSNDGKIATVSARKVAA